ncbi:MAG: DNA gyrase inhibitor YacG [Nitrosospira multiformis]|nr:DNA gyrase inhibitor YacG [Nitrosospira multiformis]
MKRPVVNCPQCGKSIVWDSSNPFRPFCSERCKLIDLGQWATESYRIPDTGKDPEKQESDPSGSEK